ncbi:MAG: signal peptidase I [Candidatus Saccharimonadales bacterium]
MQKSPQGTSRLKSNNLKDFLQLLIFCVCVIVGVIIINNYVFRSFSVDGRSMQETLQPGDRLIVNRLPITWNIIQGKTYSPNRGQIIVFKNPHFNLGSKDEFIVKRVIAFGGERVVLKDGHYTVYNSNNTKRLNPDDNNNGEPGKPTAGNIDVIVPMGNLFVSGDHRQLDPTGNPYSLDSRNGLGYIPLDDVIGPVSVRVYPFQHIRTL